MDSQAWNTLPRHGINQWACLTCHSGAWWRSIRNWFQFLPLHHNYYNENDTYTTTQQSGSNPYTVAPTLTSQAFWVGLVSSQSIKSPGVVHTLSDCYRGAAQRVKLPPPFNTYVPGAICTPFELFWGIVPRVQLPQCLLYTITCPVQDVAFRDPCWWTCASYLIYTLRKQQKNMVSV